MTLAVGAALMKCDVSPLTDDGMQAIEEAVSEEMRNVGIKGVSQRIA